MVGGIGRFFPWCVRDVAKAICAAAGAAALWPTVDPQARAIVGPQAKVPDRWLAQGSLGGVTALAYARRGTAGSAPYENNSPPSESWAQFEVRVGPMWAHIGPTPNEEGGCGRSERRGGGSVRRRDKRRVTGSDRCRSDRLAAGTEDG